MKARVCVVVAVEFTFRAFLVDQLRVLGRTHDLTVVINTQNSRLLEELDISGSLYALPIQRKIAAWSDVLNLVELIRLFKRERFVTVHSITPKAGLLATMAGFVTRTPIRIHTFTGQVWASKSGVGNFMLKRLDGVIARLATHVLVDSESQLDFLEREHVVPRGKARVLGQGSISGVDLDRFAPNPEVRIRLRLEAGLSDGHIVFLFVGRLTRDKGVLDLAWAFLSLAREHENVYLWIVGPDEEGMTIQIQAICEPVQKHLRFFGLTNQPEAFMAAADVLCLPSYREGFGSVIIEAAAVGLPAVASRIYGITDAIKDQQTGLLHTPATPEDLTAKMTLLVTNASLRERLGLQAQIRARKLFSQQVLTTAFMEFYEQALRGHQT